MSRSTWDTSRRVQNFTYRTFTLSGRTFQTVLLFLTLPYQGPATPGSKPPGLGCSAFARHYLRNHYCFLFLRVLRCFTSPGLALKPYFIQAPVPRHYSERVSPFGNPRIKACLPLPEAYRSLPRPSSPADAKASIVCPSIFDQNHGQFDAPVVSPLESEPTSDLKLLARLYAIFKEQIIPKDAG